jgi:hypothetical protein
MRSRPSVGIARHQPHTAEAAGFEIAKQLVVPRFALSIGDGDREDRPMPVCPHARDDEHALTDDPTAWSDMFVAGIDAEIRIGRLGYGPTPPRIEIPATYSSISASTSAFSLR